MAKLTAKQQIFVKEYLVDLNATQAAVRAGYSVRTAEWVGPRLVTKSHVAVAIEAAVAERGKSLDVTQGRVLLELARIALGDKRKVVSWGPAGIEIKASDDLTDDAAAMVSEVVEEDTKYGTRRRIKVHDKVKALELLGRHLGLFTDKIVFPDKNGDPQNVGNRFVGMTLEELEREIELCKRIEAATEG